MAPICWLVLGLVWAQPPSEKGAETERPAWVQAELERLRHEQKKLVLRNAWTGVAEAYERMKELEVDLQFNDHHLASMATRKIGDTSKAYVQLDLAIKLDPKEELLQERDEINQNYGRMVIEVNGRTDTLLRTPMPFDPEQRASLAFADATLQEQGRFVGMLPIGQYEMGEWAFSVSTGPWFTQIALGESRGGLK